MFTFDGYRNFEHSYGLARANCIPNIVNDEWRVFCILHDICYVCEHVLLSKSSKQQEKKNKTTTRK